MRREIGAQAGDEYKDLFMGVLMEACGVGKFD